MKTTLILMFLLCLVPFSGFADEEPTELGESAELEEFEDQYVGGGGPMPTLLFLDLEDLNSAIIDAGYPQISQVLFANGGGGYGGALDGPAGSPFAQRRLPRIEFDVLPADLSSFGVYDSGQAARIQIMLRDDCLNVQFRLAGQEGLRHPAVVVQR